MANGNSESSNVVSSVSQHPIGFSLSVADDGQSIVLGFEGGSLGCLFVFHPDEASNVGRALIAASQLAQRKLKGR